MFATQCIPYYSYGSKYSESKHGFLQCCGIKLINLGSDFSQKLSNFPTCNSFVLFLFKVEGSCLRYVYQGRLGD